MLHELIHDPEFWVAISSVITFAFLIKKGWAPILSALDRRSDVIRSRLNEAETLYRDAQALLAEYQARSANAAEEAENILQAARRRADVIVAQAQSDLQKAVAQQENSSRLRIQRAEQDVIEAIREAIVKAALNRVQAQLEETGASSDTIGTSLQSVSKSFH